MLNLFFLLHLSCSHHLEGFPAFPECLSLSSLRVGFESEESLQDWNDTFKGYLSHFLKPYGCAVLELFAVNGSDGLSGLLTSPSPPLELVPSPPSPIPSLELVLADAGTAGRLLLARPGRLAVLGTARRVFNHTITAHTAGVLVRLTETQPDMHSWADLVRAAPGLVLCAVARGSFAGYQIQSLELLRATGRAIPELFGSVVWAGRPEHVVAGLLEGRCQVGALESGVLETLQLQEGLDMSRWTVLGARPSSLELPYVHSTALYPQAALLALPHMPARVAALVHSALTALDDTFAVSRGRLAGFNLAAEADYEESGLVSYHLDLQGDGSCPPGHQRHRPPQTTTPGLAPPQTITPALCQPCPPGAYSETGLECHPCPTRYYANSSGAVSCDRCTDGSSTDGPGGQTCRPTAGWASQVSYEPLEACAGFPNSTLQVLVVQSTEPTLEDSYARWCATFEHVLNGQLGRYGCFFRLTAVKSKEVDRLVRDGSAQLLFGEAGLFPLWSDRHGARALVANVARQDGQAVAGAAGLIIRLHEQWIGMDSLQDIATVSATGTAGQLCAVGPDSFTGKLAQEYEFMSQGLDMEALFKDRLKYMGSHQEVIRQVLSGECMLGLAASAALQDMLALHDVGAATFALINAQELPGLGLASTPAYEGLTLAALPAIPADLAQRVAATLLTIRNYAGFQPVTPDSFAKEANVNYQLNRFEPQTGRCAPGANRVQNGNRLAACLPCPPQTFSPDGLSGCLSCPVGSYSQATGASSCSACACDATQPECTTHVRLSHSAQVAIWVVSGLCLLLCLTMWLMVTYHRRSRLMKASSAQFNIVFLTGCVVLCASTLTFTFLPTADNWICGLRWWLPCLAASTIFSTLFAKMYRLYAFWSRHTMLQHNQLIQFNSTRVGCVLSVGLLFTAGSLTIFFLTDRPSYTQHVTPRPGGGTLVADGCKISAVFVPIIFSCYFLLLLVQGWLAYRVRKLPTIFNESNLIAWLLYHSASLGGVGLAIDYILQPTQLTEHMLLRSILLLLGACSPVCVLYLPKLSTIWQQEANSSRYASRLEQKPSARLIPQVVPVPAALPDNSGAVAPGQKLPVAEWANLRPTHTGHDDDAPQVPAELGPAGPPDIFFRPARRGIPILPDRRGGGRKEHWSIDFRKASNNDNNDNDNNNNNSNSSNTGSAVAPAPAPAPVAVTAVQTPSDGFVAPAVKRDLLNDESLISLPDLSRDNPAQRPGIPSERDLRNRMQHKGPLPPPPLPRAYRSVSQPTSRESRVRARSRSFQGEGHSLGQDGPPTRFASDLSGSGSSGEGPSTREAAGKRTPPPPPPLDASAKRYKELGPVDTESMPNLPSLREVSRGVQREEAGLAAPRDSGGDNSEEKLSKAEASTLSRHHVSYSIPLSNRRSSFVASSRRPSAASIFHRLRHVESSPRNSVLPTGVDEHDLFGQAADQEGDEAERKDYNAPAGRRLIPSSFHQQQQQQQQPDVPPGQGGFPPMRRSLSESANGRFKLLNVVEEGQPDLQEAEPPSPAKRGSPSHALVARALARCDSSESFPDLPENETTSSLPKRDPSFSNPTASIGRRMSFFTSSRRPSIAFGEKSIFPRLRQVERSPKNSPLPSGEPPPPAALNESADQKYEAKHITASDGGLSMPGKRLIVSKFVQLSPFLPTRKMRMRTPSPQDDNAHHAQAGQDDPPYLPRSLSNSGRFGLQLDVVEEGRSDLRGGDLPDLIQAGPPRQGWTPPSKGRAMTTSTKRKLTAVSESMPILPILQDGVRAVHEREEQKVGSARGGGLPAEGGGLGRNPEAALAETEGGLPPRHEASFSQAEGKLYRREESFGKPEALSREGSLGRSEGRGKAKALSREGSLGRSEGRGKPEALSREGSLGRSEGRANKGQTSFGKSEESLPRHETSFTESMDRRLSFFTSTSRPSIAFGEKSIFPRLRHAGPSPRNSALPTGAERDWWPAAGMEEVGFDLDQEEEQASESKKESQSSPAADDLAGGPGRRLIQSSFVSLSPLMPGGIGTPSSSTVGEAIAADGAGRHSPGPETGTLLRRHDSPSMVYRRADSSSRLHRREDRDNSPVPELGIVRDSREEKLFAQTSNPNPASSDEAGPVDEERNSAQEAQLQGQVMAEDGQGGQQQRRRKPRTRSSESDVREATDTQTLQTSLKNLAEK
eukprot:g77014.t1